MDEIGGDSMDTDPPVTVEDGLAGLDDVAPCRGLVPIHASTVHPSSAVAPLEG